MLASTVIGFAGSPVVRVVVAGTSSSSSLLFDIGFRGGGGRIIFLIAADGYRATARVGNRRKRDGQREEIIFLERPPRRRDAIVRRVGVCVAGLRADVRVREFRERKNAFHFENDDTHRRRRHSSTTRESFDARGAKKIIHRNPDDGDDGDRGR